jgi:hypothetical protein
VNINTEGKNHNDLSSLSLSLSDIKGTILYKYVISEQMTEISTYSFGIFMAAKETVLVLEHPPYFSHLDPM